MIIPLDLTQLSFPGFTLTVGLPSSFQPTESAAGGGGALWRACNLTSFSSCLTGSVDYPFASRHKGPRFKSPGGFLCETGILLLALSRYTANNVTAGSSAGAIPGQLYLGPHSFQGDYFLLALLKRHSQKTSDNSTIGGDKTHG